MEIKPPCIITSRLMEGVRIRQSGQPDLEISIEVAKGRAPGDYGKIARRYFFDCGNLHYTAADLWAHGDNRTALASLLSFMGAAGEAHTSWTHGRMSDNADLFPRDVMEMCQQYSDEIFLAREEIEGE